MYVCMYVCIYVCTCVCMCICMYICMYICMFKLVDDARRRACRNNCQDCGHRGQPEGGGASIINKSFTQ